MNLEAKNVKFSIENYAILKGISLKLDNNQFHTLMGPNGCGKTSFLKNVYKIYNPQDGVIYLNLKDVADYKLKELFKDMAVVAQFNNLSFDLSVREMVLLGRTPHLRLMEKESILDYEKVDNALRSVGMYEKRNRSYLSLSGGEKQRVVLARAIAQEPKLIIMDEPTNHLDIKYQLEILKIVKSLNVNVLAVLHDIQLAIKFSDYLYFMKDGKIKYEGKPQQVVTKNVIKDIYDVDCEIIKGANDAPVINYL